MKISLHPKNTSHQNLITTIIIKIPHSGTGHRNLFLHQISQQLLLIAPLGIGIEIGIVLMKGIMKIEVEAQMTEGGLMVMIEEDLDGVVAAVPGSATALTGSVKVGILIVQDLVIVSTDLEDLIVMNGSFLI